ncbi:sensor histidine kinase [Mesorhizobium mediterraneum]|uniref:sensor histidine kinase n=1 Tax=Mesorhizobium mediterraneum TaxID=43617 RepID=UPI00177BAF86|nr:response regulator [Mesorhizobium mediterraneum]
MATTAIRLLYIDDDAALSRLVRKEFERHGYSVEIAPSGEEGLGRLRTGGVDVVALDHYMPGRDGLETLAAIRADPMAPPVVYVTGSEEGRVAIAALKAGAADYVIKDIGGEFLALLRAAIESALAQARLRREKEAAEAEVRAARDRFEALAVERAVLLREVNHRVGNSLQLVSAFLNMQSAGSDDPHVKAALAATYGRVLAVAQIHKRLYTSDDVRSVSLDQYLQALVTDIEASAANAAGWLSLAADPVVIDPDRAVAIGVIVTELIINAMKHAYPSGKGPVRVSLHAQADSSIRLSVEDDGVGAESSSSERSSGLGHVIIEAMATKLGATVTIDRDHRGMRVLVDFA